MDLLKSFLFVTVGITITAWSYIYVNQEKQVNYVTTPGEIDSNAPPCLQMFYNIEKYAEEYNIPRKYAFGVANVETGYRGPFHWTYKHALTSPAGAVGPMQIMPQYADPYVDEEDFTEEDLRNNIEMNVKASMRILRKLKDKHGSWELAFGAYNTGRPVINAYAVKVSNYSPAF